MNATTTTFNGWTNKQTWNINLTYEEIFRSILEENIDLSQDKEDIIEQAADAFESIVNELEFEPLKEGTIAHQAVGEYLEEVNWEEIATSLFEER